MIRMTGPDCAAMCNLIIIHTYIHVSSIPANGIFLTKKIKTKTKNAQRVEND